MAGGGWEQETEAGLETQKRALCPTNNHMNSFRRTTISKLECLTHRPSPPNWPTGTFNVPHTSPIFLVAYFPCALPQQQVGAFAHKLMSTCSQPASFCRIGERQTNLSISRHCLGKTNRRLSIPDLVLRNSWIFKNFLPKENMKDGVSTSTEKVWESLRIPNLAHWWRYFFPKASQ